MARTTVILAIMAASMAAFIFFFERDMITSRETDKRKGHLLQRFVRSRVQKLEIQRKDKTTILVKRVAKDDDEELGGWYLEKPWSVEADEPIVDKLLGDLEWMDPHRTLENIGDSDIKRFGLDKPRLRAWFTVGKQRVPIVVGKIDTTGRGYYLQLDDPSTAYIVDKESVDALDHPPEYFHTKKLHDGVSVYTTDSIKINETDKSKVIEKRKGAFWLVRPKQQLASYQSVEDLVDKFDDMKATHFVSYNIDSLDKYGLGSPLLEVIIQMTQYDSKTKKNSEQKPFHIKIGSKCGDREGESYVLSGVKGPIMCISDKDILDAKKLISNLPAKHLLTMRASEVEKVRMSAGSKRLELDLKNAEWKYKVYKDKDILASGNADRNAVEQWFSKLSKTEMNSSIPLTEQTSIDKGITKPKIVLSFIPSKEENKMVIRIGASQGENIFVQRAEEPNITLFPRSSLELLNTSSIYFRNRQLIDESEDVLAHFEIQRGGVTEKLTKEDDEKWMIHHPIKLRADGEVVGDFSNRLSNLEAIRFVEDIPNSSHGLKTPTMVITAQYSGHTHHSEDINTDKNGKKTSAERSYSLRIGRQAEGGYFAQLNSDKAVFIVSDTLVELVSSPMIDRSMLSTQKDQIQKVKIVKGDRSIEINRQGDGFRLLGEKMEGLDVGAIVDNIAKLHASKIMEYGDVIHQVGGGLSGVQITVTRKDDAASPHEYQLTAINIPTRSKEASKIQMQRSDIPVRFIVPIRQVEHLLYSIK